MIIKAPMQKEMAIQQKQKPFLKPHTIELHQYIYKYT